MAAHDTRAFEEAERRLFARFGLEVESRFLELRDPPMRARVLEVGAGPPVLLVHGGGAQAAIWAPLLAELRGFRLLALDRPGCGLSDPFDYTGVDLRRHAVSFLESALDALGLTQVPLVGNSMGGLWGLWLAVERPERVSSLALSGIPALLLDSSAPFAFRLLGVPWLNRLLLAMQPPSPKQARRLMEQLLGRRAATAMEPEFIEVAYRGDMLPGAVTAFRTLVEGRVGPFGVRPGLNFGEDELRRVVQPTLFVWGDRDVFGGPEYGRRACAIMPNARLEVIPGGHAPWWDDAKRCGELVSAFLGTRASVA